MGTQQHNRHVIYILGWLLSCPIFATTGPLFNASMLGGNLQVSTTIPGKTYSLSGVRIDTPGYSFTNPGSDCQLISNGYCIFSSSNTPANIGISGPPGAFSATVAANGYAPVNLMQVTITGNRFLYVTGYYSPSNYPTLVCPIYTATGELGTCSVATQGFRAIKITINPANTRAYLSLPDTNAVEVCSINRGTGALYNCILAGTITSPAGMAFSSSGTQAYVITDEALGSINQCSIDQTTGAFSACTNTGSLSPQLAYPTDITLNPENTLAYVSNLNASLAICQVEPSTGSVSNCSTQGTVPSTGGQYGQQYVELNAAGDHLYLTNSYATAGTPNLYLCALVDGIATGCTLTGALTTVQEQGQLVLNSAGTQAYGSNTDLSLLSLCSVDSMGLLSQCHVTNSEVHEPTGMAIF